MELTELKDRIIESFSGSAEQLQEVLELVALDHSVFPFNEYEHLICNSINRGCLTFEQYIEIRNDYISEIQIYGYLRFRLLAVLAKGLPKLMFKAKE